MGTLTIFPANICNYKIPLACFARPVCTSVKHQASNTYAYHLLFRLSGTAMGKSTKSSSSRPSILKNNQKYAGTPMKKPSCTFLRSVLVQTDWTFDNQIRELSGGPPPPTSAPTPTTRDAGSTQAAPSETRPGATVQASAMSSQQPLPEVIRLEDGTVLVERRGNFAGRPPPATAASSHVDSPTASSSSSESSS